MQECGFDSGSRKIRHVERQLSCGPDYWADAAQLLSLPAVSLCSQRNHHEACALQLKAAHCIWWEKSLSSKQRPRHSQEWDETSETDRQDHYRKGALKRPHYLPICCHLLCSVCDLLIQPSDPESPHFVLRTALLSLSSLPPPCTPIWPKKYLCILESPLPLNIKQLPQKRPGWFTLPPSHVKISTSSTPLTSTAVEWLVFI